jgi:N-acetylglucosaminyl-diphospho-decaprenol L-rhamnosyltransferase
LVKSIGFSQGWNNKRVVDLSIIIVSWNVADLLESCLNSIIYGPVAVGADSGALPTVEIIVVDSASQDDTVEMLPEQFPQVKLLAQAENLGFTRCNNIGLQEAQGRYLMLLNPDTEVIGSALPKMIEYLDNNSTVGIVGPHTLNSDGTTQSTRRRFPTVPLAFFESTWMQPFAPKALLDHYYVNDASDESTLDVDWVQGSALIARREIYEQIGGLDEGYVMFSEEMDWCRRAKDAGWRVVYLGAAKIIHHGGKSTDQAVASRHIYFQQSKLRYFRKYHGWLVTDILRLYLLALYLGQIGLEEVKRLLGNQPQMRQERIRAYWQVLRSGLKVG